jgi:hypothetical protein
MNLINETKNKISLVNYAKEHSMINYHNIFDTYVFNNIESLNADG